MIAHAQRWAFESRTCCLVPTRFNTGTVDYSTIRSRWFSLSPKPKLHDPHCHTQGSSVYPSIIAGGPAASSFPISLFLLQIKARFVGPATTYRNESWFSLPARHSKDSTNKIYAQRRRQRILILTMPTTSYSLLGGPSPNSTCGILVHIIMLSKFASATRSIDGYRQNCWTAILPLNCILRFLCALPPQTMPVSRIQYNSHPKSASSYYMDLSSPVFLEASVFIRFYCQ